MNPKKGDEIYVDTWLFLTHGEDDFIGGLCKVSQVESKGDGLWIEVEEDPGAWYNWTILEPEQFSLKGKFGEKRGYKKPDERNEFSSFNNAI